MVKGISRRVVVVDSPDQRFFEQAIFIVRNDAVGGGVTAGELVEEARRETAAGSAGQCGISIPHSTPSWEPPESAWCG